jgi:hypothetical protein
MLLTLPRLNEQDIGGYLAPNVDANHGSVGENALHTRALKGVRGLILGKLYSGHLEAYSQGVFPPTQSH